MATQEISNMDDVIDSRDVIARIEELEGEIESYDGNLEENDSNVDNKEELKTLMDFMGGLEGNGGDEQWRGDWYPVTIIRDSYFESYAQELVSDIGDLPKNIPNYLVIDWEATASNIQQDYTSVEFDGITYWVR